MLFITENLNNCFDKLRFRSFDWFGNNPKFHIRGNEKFQTNTGAFVTFLYICLIFGCIAFYTMLLVDNTSPAIETNVYTTDLETIIDFTKDDVAWLLVHGDQILVKNLHMMSFKKILHSMLHI